MEKAREWTKADRQKKKKASKKFLWIIVAAIVLIAAIYFFWPRQKEVPGIALTDTTTLSQGDFINSITSSGRVESSNARYIYSTLSYPVEEIFVDVGDVVAEGISSANWTAPLWRNRSPPKKLL